jgi:hypothetical protein
MKSFIQTIFTKKFYFVLILFISISPKTFAQNTFSHWFENKALRIDYFLAGNNLSQNFYLDELKEEPYWSGSHSYPIDTLDLGSYRVEVTDKETGTLLFVNGFCTLFQEWQTVEEAKWLNRAFEQVTRIPYPKNRVVVTFKYRDKGTGLFVELYQFEVDPQSIFINRLPIAKYEVTPIVNNGNPNSKLDIAFIAEGYTADQMEKFIADVKKLTNYLFSQQPFSLHTGNINIWAIESPSDSEGPTNPGTGIWNSTATQSSFYTFGIDRYLTTTKYKRVMDIAANAPADIVYILVNTNEYGGGGIYNHYNVTTSNHALTQEVFIHELGHGLAGLGDEYFTSDVAYQDFYPLHIEPWEPNITTMVDFGSKWADMISQSTPIPTPTNELYKNTIGVFEGGGYVSKGVFRPHIDCRMKSNEATGFCPVCQRAIDRVICTYVE